MGMTRFFKQNIAALFQETAVFSMKMALVLNGATSVSGDPSSSTGSGDNSDKAKNVYIGLVIAAGALCICLIICGLCGGCEMGNRRGNGVAGAVAAGAVMGSRVSIAMT